ncbi:hypothetical protein AMTRI_Chr01g102640 [Amborella trichopoda]
MIKKRGTSLANLRCPHCIDTVVGGTASAFYGFNHMMPIVQKWIKGPMWVHFLVGVTSPVILFSRTCAGLADATNKSTLNSLRERGYSYCV